MDIPCRGNIALYTGDSARLEALAHLLIAVANPGCCLNRAKKDVITTAAAIQIESILKIEGAA